VGVAGHAAVLAEGMVLKAAVCEPRATSVSTGMASAAMTTKVTAAMTPTMASMASTAMTAASAERYARNYGRENNDDNPNARFRHGTLAAADVNLARKLRPRSL
jgi:hypothetical protein